MQRTLLFLLVLSGLSTLRAQNLPPQVSQCTATVTGGDVTFSYTLSDTENDPCDISIRVSADSGRTWLTPLTGLSGDLGYPVTPGSRSIVWNYDTQALANLLNAPAGPRGFLARIIADDRQPVDLAPFAQAVDSARLLQRLQALEGVRHRTGNPTHLQNTRDALHSQITAHGLQDVSQPFTYASYACENIIARQPGLTEEDTCWNLSGHYDTVFNSPGADDNGTSIAALEEAMDILSPLYFRRTLRYLAFDVEEAGLVGSIRYVQNLPAEEALKGTVNLEMIGYYSTDANSQVMPSGFNLLFPAVYDSVATDSFRGNFLTNVANTASSALKSIFDSCARAFVPGLRVLSLETPGTGTLTPDLRRSDHAPFWDAGYPALMLTDGADTRNPYYHTTQDSVNTLDPAFFVQNVRAAVVTMARLAGPMHAGVDTAGYFELMLPVQTPSPETAQATLYPNPGSGDFRLRIQAQQAGDLRIQAFDMQGRSVMPPQQYRLSTGQQEFPLLLTLPPGQYEVQVDGPGIRTRLPLRVLR